MHAKTILKKMSNRKFYALAGAACFLLAAPPLMAQDYGDKQQYQGQQGQQGQHQQQEYQYQQQPQQEAQQQQSADFDDKSLKKFAKVQTDLDEIRAKYSQEVQQVEEPDKARELQSKYRQQLIDAIRDNGLDIQTYNEISGAMQDNPELQEKIDKMAN